MNLKQTNISEIPNTCGEPIFNYIIQCSLLIHEGVSLFALVNDHHIPKNLVNFSSEVVEFINNKLKEK